MDTNQGFTYNENFAKCFFKGNDREQVEKLGVLMEDRRSSEWAAGDIRLPMSSYISFAVTGSWRKSPAKAITPECGLNNGARNNWEHRRSAKYVRSRRYNDCETAITSVVSARMPTDVSLMMERCELGGWQTTSPSTYIVSVVTLGPRCPIAGRVLPR